MKTNHLKHIILGLLVCGIAFPVLASTSGDSASASTDATASTDQFTSDKPAVTYLFHHTDAKPYDIKCLSWYGGVMERIVVENKSGLPITVDFRIRKLANGVVAAPARRNKVSKVCESGKIAVLLDMLSSDGSAALSYSFTHHLKGGNTMARLGNPGIKDLIAAQ